MLEEGFDKVGDFRWRLATLVQGLEKGDLRFSSDGIVKERLSRSLDLFTVESAAGLDGLSEFLHGENRPRFRLMIQA